MNIHVSVGTSGFIYASNVTIFHVSKRHPCFLSLWRMWSLSLSLLGEGCAGVEQHPEHGWSPVPSVPSAAVKGLIQGSLLCIGFVEVFSEKSVKCSNSSTLCPPSLPSEYPFLWELNPLNRGRNDIRARKPSAHVQLLLSCQGCFSFIFLFHCLGLI